MALKALTRVARLIVLVVSPLVTAPTAAAELPHGSLVAVRSLGDPLVPAGADSGRARREPARR